MGADIISSRVAQLHSFLGDSWWDRGFGLDSRWRIFKAFSCSPPNILNWLGAAAVNMGINPIEHPNRMCFWVNLHKPAPSETFWLTSWVLCSHSDVQMAVLYVFSSEHLLGSRNCQGKQWLLKPTVFAATYPSIGSAHGRCFTVPHGRNAFALQWAPAAAACIVNFW